MKAYKGSFKKQNGQIREMLFAKIEDLPDTFIEQKVVGSGAAKQYPADMELVWDLEADNFRVFNWGSLQAPVKELQIDKDYFT